PGDLDTLRAWAVAEGDTRSAFLLVGSRDGPSTGHEGTNHGSQQGRRTMQTNHSSDTITVKIVANDRGNPAGKLADAELHFGGESPLAGLKLIGFSIWERRGGNGRNVTFPARQYSVNGERRSFALLRPVVDTTAQSKLRDLILEAFQAYEERAAIAS